MMAKCRTRGVKVRRVTNELKTASPVAFSRGALVVAIVVLSIGAMTSTTLFLPAGDFIALLLWLLGCAGWGVAFSGSKPRPADERVLWLVSAFAMGVGIVAIACLCLGLAGWLNRASGAALLGCGCAMSLRRVARAWDITTTWLRDRAGWSWLLVLLVPVVALCLTGTTVLPGILFGFDEPAGYDAVGYHLQVPREWFEMGRVEPLWHNTFSLHPMLVEMHYLLAMHLRGGPWAGMYLAQLMHAAMCLAVPVAVYGTVRPMGALRATLAALACASVPWVPMLGAVAYNEGALMLFTILALACMLRDRWLVGGALLGFACGTKYTGFVTALALVPVVCGVTGLIFPRERFAQLRGAAIALGVGLLVASPWLIRNAAWTSGNPVFPLLADALGKARWDEGQVQRFNAAHAPRADQQSLSARWDAFVTQVVRDEKYGTPAGQFSVLILLGAAAALGAIHRREGATIVLLLAGLTGYWLFATHLQGRFFVQAIPLLAIALACVPVRWLAITACGTTVLINAWSARPIVERNAKWLVFAGMPAPDALLREVLLPSDAFDAVMGSERPIVLIGDAKAFWYPVPMSRLRYRYVFDVPSVGNDLVQTWVKDVPRDAVLLVDPAELRRFAATYRALPRLDDKTAREPQVFLTRVGSGS
jgi:hypothetical protein